MRLNHLIYGIVAMFFVSCNGAPLLDKADYLNWVESEKNLCKVSQKSENLIVTCFYTPLDYILLKEQQNGVLQQEGISKRGNELSKLKIFQFILVDKGGRSILDDKKIAPEEKENREQYLRNDLEKNIVLEHDTNTVSPVLYHLERNHGISPEVKVIVGFNNQENLKEFKLKLEINLIDKTSMEFEYDLTHLAKLTEQ